MTQENSPGKDSETQLIQFPTEGIITDVLPGGFFGLKDSDGLFASVMVGMDCRAYLIRIPVSEDHSIIGHTKVLIDREEVTDPETGKIFEEYSIKSSPDASCEFSIRTRGVRNLKSA